MQNEKVEVLLKEYEARRAEINVANTQYRQTVGLSYLYLPALVTATGLFSSAVQGGTNPLFSASHSASSQQLWLFILSLAFLMGISLFAHALDSLSMMALLATRSAQIERLVNEELGSDLLVWDSRIIPRWYASSYAGKGIWIKPQFLLGSWTFLFVSATNAFLCVIMFNVAPLYAMVFSVCVAAITAFNILQWVLTLVVGSAEMERVVTEPNPTPSQESLEVHSASEASLAETLRQTWPIIVVSVLLGPIPMVICSVLTNSFWPSSPHPFPFLKIPSVAIGDSIMLPMFNAYAYRLFQLHESRVRSNFTKSGVMIAFVTAFALGVQYWVHTIWANDPYTGFMDLSRGTISFAGWWHLVYAGLETTVVITYLYIWARTVASHVEAHRMASKGWLWFIAYTSVGIADMFLHWHTTFAGMKFIDLLKIEASNPIKVLVAIGVLELFRRIHQSRLNFVSTASKASKG